jgi:hypothetical protein
VRPKLWRQAREFRLEFRNAVDKRAGIDDKHLADRARKLRAKTDAEFEEFIRDTRAEVKLGFERAVVRADERAKALVVSARAEVKLGGAAHTRRPMAFAPPRRISSNPSHGHEPDSGGGQ